MYRIIVIEDDLLMQRVLRDVIKPEGFEVRICPDGKTGLKTVPEDKPDLVILDVHLPDMDGHEVCRVLKSDPRTKRIPVLMLTGEARDIDSRVRGLEIGAEDYLFKPISGKVLVSRINSILNITSKPTK